MIILYKQYKLGKCFSIVFFCDMPFKYTQSDYLFVCLFVHYFLQKRAQESLPTKSGILIKYDNLMLFSFSYRPPPLCIHSSQGG